MPTMTLKEWATEYRKINEWEQQERIALLPRRSVEASVRSYFALCQMLLPFSLEAGQHAGLWEQRMKHYISLIEKWQRLARKGQRAAQS